MEPGAIFEQPHMINLRNLESSHVWSVRLFLWITGDHVFYPAGVYSGVYYHFCWQWRQVQKDVNTHLLLQINMTYQTKTFFFSSID